MSNHQPTSIIILGGGGDLAQRKLFPSLFNLFLREDLPRTFCITGLARTVRTHAEYREFVGAAILKAFPSASQEKIVLFCTHVRYIAGALDDEKSYADLKDSILNFESEVGAQVNELFYLAIPPAQYETTFLHLHKCKLVQMDADSSKWGRILVEKPFGNDLNTAQALDKMLSSLFKEEQIFRIDHYLAKEAVQNILSFRFANTLLQSPWNREHIKEVKITMHEKIDVGTRGAFYDTIGALRDVGQNHLLQILALIAMDEPADLTAEHIRAERAAILEKLTLFTKDTIQGNVTRAQYEGYRDSANVDPESTTETYFAFKAFIDTDTWRDVPFYASAGKALNDEKVCVEILFHDVATGPFETSACATVGNCILLTISPEQSMQITLNVKKPGQGYEIESHTLSYVWNADNSRAATAYEKVLHDCIVGDQTIFTRSEEVLASWKFISSILENWFEIPLLQYTKGSDIAGLEMNSLAISSHT